MTNDPALTELLRRATPSEMGGTPDLQWPTCLRHGHRCPDPWDCYEQDVNAYLEHARTEQQSITCPDCGRTSWNPNDIRERYCGYCHWWTSDPTLRFVRPDTEARSVIPWTRRLRDKMTRQYTDRPSPL